MAGRPTRLGQKSLGHLEGTARIGRRSAADHLIGEKLEKRGTSSVAFLAEKKGNALRICLEDRLKRVPTTPGHRDGRKGGGSQEDTSGTGPLPCGMQRELVKGTI